MTIPSLGAFVTVSIRRKMIVGYIALIFIPVIVFGYYYYNQVFENLTKHFIESRQKIMEQAYSNMKVELTRIQSIHRLLQYNPYVRDHLEGVHESTSDIIYTYTRYISPLFTQSLYVNPEIETIMIHTNKEGVFSIPDRIFPMQPPAELISQSLRAGEGAWRVLNPDAAEPSLVYYQNIYNHNITELLGLLEIRVNRELMRSFIIAAGVDHNWVSMLIAELPPADPTQPIEDLDSESLKWLMGEEHSQSLFNQQVIANQLYIKELSLRLIIIGKLEHVFRSIKQREIILLLTIAALLAALSIMYYILASTITKRIFRLARHMRNLGDDNLKLMDNRRGSQDEIGFLITTYNNMISRLDELINNVHRAELRHKEAAYQVLQAQIKPHFLYNTLETIRMLAEANNDKEVADISFWFGKLMRYSLSPQEDRTVLAKEVETVTFYLNIHKMRLQNRLTYEITVALDAEMIECPRFMLQPLVENSIVHGASAVIRPVHIQLKVEEISDEIRISIIDNGPGIQQDKLTALQNKLAGINEYRLSSEEEGGVGLYNVNERIKAFYRGASRLELRSEQGYGTSLTIIIDKRMASDR